MLSIILKIKIKLEYRHNLVFDLRVPSFSSASEINQLDNFELLGCDRNNKDINSSFSESKFLVKTIIYEINLNSAKSISIP